MHKPAVVVILAALAAGCATTRAAAPIERPALDVPPAPPRVIEPAPAPEAPGPELVSDLPPEKPATPTRPRPAARETREAKPETKTETPPPAPAEIPAVAAPNPQPPTLRTTPAVDAAAAERRVRDTMGRAQGLLGSIDYQRLNPQRRSAYDQAKDSIDGAEAALKAANLELAKEMAEKAEKLARELQTR